MIGVGSQDDFDEAQDFLGDTGVSQIPMLWEGTGNVWNINQVRINSAMQLFTHDLSQQSDLIFFNEKGRKVVLEAVVQSPWAPPGSPFLNS